MPEAVYTYTLSSDFSSGIDTQNLKDEIISSSINQQVSYISIIISGDQVRIVFKNALTIGEQTTLDTIVSNHDPSFRIRPEEIPIIATNSIIQMGDTGSTQVQDFSFNNNSFEPINGTGYMLNMTIDADLNPIINIDNDNIKSNAGINTTKIGNGTVDNTEFSYLNGVTSNLQSQLNSKASTNHSHTSSDITDFNSSVDSRITLQKGNSNGIATLDSGGKIPASQLNLDSVVYQGTWNATTNNPTLLNGSGTKGHYYVVSIAGSTNLDGVTDWNPGDWAIFNGTIWEKADHTDQVTSVAGKQGAVTLEVADITDFDTEVANNSSVVANTNHAANSSLHRVINDSGTSTTELWSANKINSELDNKVGAPNSSTNNTVPRFDGTAGNLVKGSGVLIDDSNNLTIGSATTGTVYANKELVMRQDGDTYGSSLLRLRNRTGENGAIFETTDDSITLVDFIFKTYANQRNIRYESRGTSTFLGTPEFQIGSAADPTLCIDDTGILVRGDLSISGSVDGRDVSVDGATLDSHVADLSKHRIINDSGTSATELWSASKINTSLAGKSNTNHTHSATNITSGTLPVARGGIGVGTLASGRILQGNGTGAITAILTAPSGALVGTTDSQTLTNKIISDPTNTVGANQLRTTGASVVIDTAAPPTSGQVLKATSATTATWQTVVGPQGDTGPQGATGPQGTAGTNGAQGAQGTAGTNGAQGAQGTAGTNGSQGAAGTNGPQGAQGTAGTNGAQGAQGTAGTNGAQGAQGTAGSNGAQGAQGAEGTSAESATVQARRTTVKNNLPTSWDNLTFDTTDVETDSSVLEHNDSNRERINIKQTGTYRITYSLDVDDEVEARVLLNNTTVLPGSWRKSGSPSDAVTDLQIVVTACFVAELSAGDYIAVQTLAATSAENLLTPGDAVFTCQRIIGVQGPPRPPGPAGGGQGAQGSMGVQGSMGAQGPSGGGAKCDIFYDPSNEITVGSSWEDIPLTQERVIDSNFSHSSNSPEITINTTGYYLVITRVSTYIPFGNNRTSTQMRLLLNTGSGFNEVPGSFGFMYNRQSDQGYDTCTVSSILNLSSGDKLKMQVIRFSGSSTIRLISGGSGMTLTSI